MSTSRLAFASLLALSLTASVVHAKEPSAKATFKQFVRSDARIAARYKTEKKQRGTGMLTAVGTGMVALSPVIAIGGYLMQDPAMGHMSTYGAGVQAASGTIALAKAQMMRADARAATVKRALGGEYGPAAKAFAKANIKKWKKADLVVFDR